MTKQKVLLISGKRGAGATSAANFITGLMLQKAEIIDRFEINPDDGQLVVNTLTEVGDDEFKSGEGVLNLKWTHPDILTYLALRVWPTVRIYSISDPVKGLLESLFDVPHKNLYGTLEEQKENTDYKLSYFGYWIPPRYTKEYRTNGTWDKHVNADKLVEVTSEHFRRLDKDIWSTRCQKSILAFPNDLAIVDDIKYPDEIQSFKNNKKLDVKTLRLSKRVDFSSLTAEVALDKWRPNKYDGYIDNSKMELKEKNFAIIDLLKEWKWI